MKLLKQKKKQKNMRLLACSAITISWKHIGAKDFITVNKATCYFCHYSLSVINCTSLTIDPAGPLRMSNCDNNYGAQCNFSCAIGYRLNDSLTVTCVAPGNQHPGVWNKTIPTCEGKYDIFRVKIKMICSKLTTIILQRSRDNIQVLKILLQCIKLRVIFVILPYQLSTARLWR